MREIAKRIEYSATALYKHFVDKEALVRELCRHDFNALAAGATMAQSQFAVVQVTTDRGSERAGLSSLVELEQVERDMVRLQLESPSPRVQPTRN